MDKGSTVLIGGGSGMIGAVLSRLLIRNGYRVVILSRNPERARRKAPDPGVRYAEWDPARGTMNTEVLREAQCIINLAGANVGEKRWTPKRKREIVESRSKTAETFIRALGQFPHQVELVISPAGIGWYGPDPVIPNPDPFTEDRPAYTDFLATTCVQWESSLSAVKNMGIRLVLLRMGPVLSPAGGALREFIKPLRFRVATILGNGKQILSWVHVEDMARVFVHVIENRHLQGAYNVVSPVPVSNRQLMLELARTMVPGFFIPFRVPAWLIRMIFGELSVEVLKSATVSCKRLVESGFQFRFPTIAEALINLLKKGK